jgi:hypothetical protein
MVVGPDGRGGAAVFVPALFGVLIFIYAATLAALAHGPPDRGRIEQFIAQADWAAAVLALTVVAGSWAARKPVHRLSCMGRWWARSQGSVVWLWGVFSTERQGRGN